MANARIDIYMYYWFTNRLDGVFHLNLLIFTLPSVLTVFISQLSKSLLIPETYLLCLSYLNQRWQTEGTCAIACISLAMAVILSKKVLTRHLIQCTRRSLRVTGTWDETHLLPLSGFTSTSTILADAIWNFQHGVWFLAQPETHIL